MVMILANDLSREPVYCGWRVMLAAFGIAGRGAAWSARLFWVQEVVGSNPAAPTRKFNVRYLLDACRRHGCPRQRANGGAADQKNDRAMSSIR
jgi:hypothetical protein